MQFLRACQEFPTGLDELCQKQQGWRGLRKMYLSLPPNSEGLFLQPPSFAIHLSAEHEFIFKLIPSMHLKPTLFHINVLTIEINIINTDQGY